MEEFGKLWVLFDTGEVDELNLEKSNLLKKMYDITEGKTRDEIQLEINLVCFIFIVQQILERMTEVTLDKLESDVNSFVQKCDTKAIDYYKKRHDETKSRLNKWRYSFACWLIEPKKNPAFLDDAISSLITLSQSHMREEKYHDTIFLLISAFNLTKLYNFSKYDNSISDVALRIFYSIVNTPNARWMIEPTEIFGRLNRKADYNLINNIMTILHREANRFHNKNSHHLEQSLLEISIELCNLMNLSTELRDKLRNEMRIL
jgi:hypothetical protein